jgi:prevent-host-death family protein
MRWQLQQAKQKLSELVQRAQAEGPQVVTRRGREVVVVLSKEEYDRLTGAEPDFKAFLLSLPDFAYDEVVRDRTPARRVEL